MLSDIENMDILLGTDNTDRLEQNSESLTYGSVGPSSTQNGNLRPQSSNRLHNDVNHAINTLNGDNRAELDTIRRNIENITDEVDYRISRETDGLMSSMNTQIQRAINEAIISQVIPQIKSVVRDVQRNSQVRDNAPEEPERGPEDIIDPNCHSSNNDLLFSQNLQGDRQESHYMVTGANNPTNVPEFLTGRTQSQPNLHRMELDHNASLDTTIQAEQSLEAPPLKTQ